MEADEEVVVVIVALQVGHPTQTVVAARAVLLCLPLALPGVHGRFGLIRPQVGALRVGSRVPIVAVRALFLRWRILVLMVAILYLSETIGCGGRGGHGWTEGGV